MLSMSGNPFNIGTITNSKQTKMHRKITMVGNVDATTNILEWTLADLIVSMGVGATITKMVVQNMTGRSMIVTCDPKGLVLGNMSGSTQLSMPIMSRFVSAPMTRFPTCKIDIPDAFGAPSETTTWTASSKPIQVIGSSTPKDTIKLTVSYWKLVQ